MRSGKQQLMRNDSKHSAALSLIKTAMIEKKLTQAELADAAVEELLRFDAPIVDSSGNLLGSRSSLGWQLTAAQLADAHVKPAANWSGIIKLESVIKAINEKFSGKIAEGNIAAATEAGYFFSNCSSVSRAPALSFRSSWQLEILSSASGAFWLVGKRVVTVW